MGICLSLLGKLHGRFVFFLKDVGALRSIKIHKVFIPSGEDRERESINQMHTYP